MNQMRIMQEFYNPTRRILATPSLVRFTCTAVTVEHAEAVAPPPTTATETVKKVVRVKRDVLYTKLSAPGSSRASTFETLNGCFPSKNDFTSKIELDSCILQLRRSGKVPQALEVLFCP